MNRQCILWIGLLLLTIGMGCAHIQDKHLEGRTEEAFFQRSLKQAEQYEAGGAWVEALGEYRVALTLRPESRTALEGLRRAEERLESLAEEHYNLGRDLEKEGKFSEARRHFLAAVRLHPDHAQALETLTSRKRLPFHRDYIVHTLQPGESLSEISKLYYGDAAKFTLIAEFNQIQDAHAVRIGQQIKVPTLVGGRLEAPDQKGEEEDKEGPPAYWDWTWMDMETTEQRAPDEMAKAEEAYQIAGYRELGAELLREGRYQEALFELNKVLSVDPDDPLASEYACSASFELGKGMFQRKEYFAATEYFAASLRYRSDCRQSRAFLGESEELFKETYYKKGIEHYGKEQLKEAIEAWEKVQRLDPNYKRVAFYIEKAKEIQEKLEALRLETQQGLSN